METDYETIFYTPDYYELAVSWWIDHQAPVIPEAILPPSGAVTTWRGEPTAMVWIHFAKANPVAFVAHAVTAPHLDIAMAGRGLLLALDLMKEYATTMGVVMMVMTAPPGIARYVVKHSGFVAHPKPAINLQCALS